MRGKFITLEGIDGAGKSTHLAWLADFFRQRGIAVCVTREPGGTGLGEKLRKVLLDPGNSMHAETEALLMFAARREHLEEVIEPALDRGEWVVCDRFTDATFAYQGGGRGVDWQRLSQLEQWAQRGLQPDLTLLFDLAPEIGRQRARGARSIDRFEQEQDDFYRRVRDGYLRRARENPSRLRVIDASQSVEQIQQQLKAITGALCR
ncbi:MAG: dTMP kinase [Betaproteobacteria bacterium]|nr:dTMP kinase [Betaproteobacteria bacterium]